MKHVLLGMCVTALVGCGTTYSVTPGDGVEGGGLHYFLPKNTVELTVKVTEISRKRGRLSEFADRCLNSTIYKDVIESSKKEIEKPKQVTFSDARFELKAEQDSSAGFFVDLSIPWNPFVSRSGKFSLNDQSILTAGFVKSTDTSIDFALDLAKSAIGVAGSALAAGGVGVGGGGAKSSPYCGFANPLNGKEAAAEATAAAVVGLKTDIEKQQILQVEKSVYELKLAQLTRALETLLGYFSIESEQTQKDVTFVLEPGSVPNFTLMNVCEGTATHSREESYETSSGMEKIGPNRYRVLSSPAPATACSPIKIKGENEARALRRELTVAFSGGNAVGGGGDGTKGARGLYYRVPANVEFQVGEKTLKDAMWVPSTLNSTTLPIAQLGEIRSLPRRFGWLKSEITDFKLSPISGNIVELSINGENLGSAQITKITGAVLEGEKDTSVSELEREKKVLTLRKDIKALREEAAKR